MSLLPSKPDLSTDDDPRVVGLDSEEAEDLLAALSSDTARDVLSTLHEEPAPPGEIADRVDTSLQNAQYHLEKLEDAGAIEVIGTAYSQKGREMSVYGPADSPLVIFAGQEDRLPSLKSALSRLFGGFLALALAAVAVQAVFGDGLFEDVAEPEPTPAEEEIEAADDGPTPEADTAPETAEGIEAIFEWLLGIGVSPGVAFFLGGAVVLTAVVALPYLRVWFRRFRAKRSNETS